MKPATEFKRRKRRPKVKFKVEDINYKNVDLLKTFIIKAETPPRVNTFPSLFSTGDEPTIYVPANSVENYKKAEGWKKYANKIQAIP